MTISNVLRDTWDALAKEPRPFDGVYQRRVAAESDFDVFASLLHPSQLLRVTVEVSPDVALDALERETQGFKVSRQYDPVARRSRVMLDLVRVGFRDVFEIMAEDVLTSILSSKSEPDAVGAMRQKLDQWERFMRGAGPDGLSREMQVGLFGELSLLLTLLQAGLPAEVLLRWWHGPACDNQDFQAGAGGVEVKTSTANSPTLVKVSNELQLDDSDCSPLFLVHIWLREVEGSGQTLPGLIDDISHGLSGTERQRFSERLFEAGYHEMHRSKYLDAGYIERSRHCYSVEGLFPRIRRDDLRTGVSRVSYHIDLAVGSSYLCAQETVIQTLRSCLGRVE